ncbi:glycosyltransferase, partial [bacterium]|nr:glycosyltransferase [bacterium]
QEADEWIRSCAGQIVEMLRRHEKAPVLVVGPGIGYAIPALERYFDNHAIAKSRINIHCIEAFPEIARKALSLSLWEPSELKVEWSVIDESTRFSDLYMYNDSVCVLKGSADYQIGKPVYEEFLGRKVSSRLSNSRLRVLVPTPLYGGSLPAALHSADALTELGYEVELMDLSIYYDHYRDIDKLTRIEAHQKSLRGLLATFLAECIVARANEWKADLVWAVAQTPLTPPALRELRHLGIRTAFWFVEDYRLFEYWKEVCLDYDAVFTIQKGDFHRQLHALGVAHFAYLPCAANPKIHYPEALSPQERLRYGSELSFVGAGYFNRQLVFSEMKKHDLKIWGNDWPLSMIDSKLVQEDGRRVATDETRKIFNSSKVNINLHSSPQHDGINGDGDFVNPRTFEIAACGAFQLVDSRSLLPELFTSEELVAFNSIEEMKEQIERFSHDDKSRQLHAERARARVLRDHTYAKRLADAMRFMLDAFPELQQKTESSFVDSLIEAVADDSEMAEYLDKLDREAATDLDAIVSTIPLGKGKLSRPEGILLLMKEFRDWGVEKGVIS